MVRIQNFEASTQVFKHNEVEVSFFFFLLYCDEVEFLAVITRLQCHILQKSF